MPTPTPKLEWILTLEPATGQVNINGPIQDRLLTLGVLQLAAHIVYAYDPAQHLVVPKPGLTVL